MTILKFLPIFFGIVMFLIALFPILIFICIGVYAVIHNHFLEERLRVRMKRSGRFLNISQVTTKIKGERGTLIIEYPAPGWGYTRAWWTPDDVFSKSTLLLPNIEERKNLENLDWYGWCWKIYLCPDNGGAYLLRVHNGKSLEQKLKKTLSDLKVAHVFSGLYFLSISPNKENE